MAREDLVIHEIFGKLALSAAGTIALQIKTEAGWKRFTYGQVQAMALKVAAFLLGQGFKQGDFAGLILENRPEWPIIYLGIMYAGLTCVPIDPQLPPQDLENILDDCGADILFTSSEIFKKKFNRKIIESLKSAVVLDNPENQDRVIDFSRIEEMPQEGVAWPEVTPEAVASLIYTSGTTAKPKGVVLTHANLCSNFQSINQLNICLPGDNFLSILPLHHTYAFMVTLLVPLCIGARVTYCASFKPEELSGIIKEAGVTVLVGVPQLFSLLHKAICDKIKRMPFILRLAFAPFINRKVRRGLGESLRLLFSGGARLSPQVARSLWGMGFKIIEGYGLTETSPVVSFNPPARVKFGSVGKSLPGVEVKILNPDKSGAGEVLIKGANVMQGYFKQPDLTSQVIADGWFHSGDLGYLDGEGYLFLTGRAKDVIVLSSGKNIYPEELEEFFLSQSPYIKEICILGVVDSKFGKEGEALYAVIVPHLEYFRKNNEININEKIHWEIDNISRGMPSYQHIMGFFIAKEELPRTQLKKIKRYEVKQRYLKEKTVSARQQDAVLSEEDTRIMRAGLAGKVIDYLSKELKKEVGLNSHLEIDLGIDSLSRVELGLGLEALLARKMPAGFIDRVYTVRELITGLEQAAGETGPQQPGLGQEKISWAEIIRKDPAQDIMAKIKLSETFLDKLITFIFKCALGFIFRVFWLLKVEGRGHIPKAGPYILCANHASYLDGFFIFSSNPFYGAVDLFFLGQAAIFKHPSIAWAAKIARLISIDPATHLTQAMQASAFVLRHKKRICIFPEGSRSISEQVGDFKKGVGILAKELDVAIVPVYIRGSHFSWPRTARFPRPYPVKVIFGKPLSWRELGDDYETITRNLREEVLKLSTCV